MLVILAKNTTPKLKSVCSIMQNSMAAGYSILALLCSLVAAISAANAATQRLCQVPGGECGYGECTGRTCPNLYPGIGLINWKNHACSTILKTDLTMHTPSSPITCMSFSPQSRP